MSRQMDATGYDDPEFASALTRARAGDRAAMEQLLLPHLSMLHAYSQAICGDFHGAQDVVQETAVIAVTNIDKFFTESDFAAWLRGIARRQALAHARLKRRYLPTTPACSPIRWRCPLPRPSG